MRHALLVVTFLLATLSCFAQDNSQPVWSGAYSADLKSRYFGLTVSKVFADQAVFQQELDVTRQLGDTAMTFSVWNSMGFDRWFRDYAYETDLGFTVTHKLGKFTVSGTAGIFLLNPTAGFDVWQLDCRVSRTFVSGTNALTPFVEFQNRALTNKEAIHGSQYPAAGVAYRKKIAERFLAVAVFRDNYDLRGGLGRKSETSLFYSEVSFRMRLTKSITFTFPRVGYGGSYTDPQRPRCFIWSAGFTKAF